MNLIVIERLRGATRWCGHQQINLGAQLRGWVHLKSYRLWQKPAEVAYDKTSEISLNNIQV